MEEFMTVRGYEKLLRQTTMFRCSRTESIEGVADKRTDMKQMVSVETGNWIINVYDCLRQIVAAIEQFGDEVAKSDSGSFSLTQVSRWFVATHKQETIIGSYTDLNVLFAKEPL